MDLRGVQAAGEEEGTSDGDDVKDKEQSEGNEVDSELDELEKKDDEDGGGVKLFADDDKEVIPVITEAEKVRRGKTIRPQPTVRLEKVEDVIQEILENEDMKKPEDKQEPAPKEVADKNLEKFEVPEMSEEQMKIMMEQ